MVAATAPFCELVRVRPKTALVLRGVHFSQIQRLCGQVELSHWLFAFVFFFMLT